MGKSYLKKRGILGLFYGILWNENSFVYIDIIEIKSMAKGGIEPPTQGFSVLRSTN